MRTRGVLLVLVGASFVGCFQEPKDLAPFPCSTSSTCPEGLACVGGSCAVIADCQLDGSGCENPNLQRCAAVGKARKLEDGGSTDRLCVPPGTADAGALCERLDGGSDTCAAGFVCANASSGAATCLRACDVASGCEPGSVCSALDVSSSIGVCRPGCGTASCGPGSGCVTAPMLAGTLARTCLPRGTKRYDEACARDEECAEGLCVSGRCLYACNSANPCGAGFRCNSSSQDAGVCRCQLYGEACGSGRSCKIRRVSSGSSTFEEGCATSTNAVPLFESCERSDQCSRDAMCWGNENRGYACMPLCDSTHPCPASPTGGTLKCETRSVLQSGGGVCFY